MGTYFNLFRTPIFDAILTGAARAGAGLTDASSSSGSGAFGGPVSTSYAATASTRVADASAPEPSEKNSMVDLVRTHAEPVRSLQGHERQREHIAALREPKRVDLQASNPIDWDSTPTVFEAATIAHGHLLHFKQVWYADGSRVRDY